MQTYSLLFYPKKAKNNPKTSTIYLRITVAGRRTEISTRQTVKTSQWSIKSGKVTGNTPKAQQLNSLLESSRAKLFKCYNALFNEGREITCENLRNKYLGIEERKVTLIEVFKDHNSKMKELIGKEFSKGTWERYETSLRHTVLPVLSNQKTNEYLKEIGDLCEIDFDITFHTARHTFATTVTLNNGVPLETVSKMLGHTNIRMIQHYAKIQDNRIKRLVRICFLCENN